MRDTIKMGLEDVGWAVVDWIHLTGQEPLTCAF